MAENEILIKYSADTSTLTKRIEAATKAAEKLEAALARLKDVKINLEVETSDVKKKWYQFWKP